MAAILCSCDVMDTPEGGGSLAASRGAVLVDELRKLVVKATTALNFVWAGKSNCSQQIVIRRIGFLAMILIKWIVTK